MNIKMENRGIEPLTSCAGIGVSAVGLEPMTPPWKEVYLQ